MFNDAPDRDYTVAIVTAMAELKRKSALAAGGLLPRFQSASAASPPTPTAQELADYDVIAGFRTLLSGARQAVAWDRPSSAWVDGKAAAERAPLSAPAQTRGVIFRGGIAYYPAPAGLIADGVNVIDEGATGLYYRSSGDVLPWEYGALPGGEFVGSDNGAALAAWAAGAPNHSRLYLPPGHWWTGQSLVLQNTNLHLNFRGTLHAALGFTGYLVNADAGFTPAPAGQLPSYYDTTLGNALWYKRIQVEAMTLNGESRSKGVKFSRFDHYHISNVTVHKSYGHGIAMDRMREGNAYNFNILHSRAGPDNALFDLSEQGPADSTNVVNYFGIRIAVFTGRAMYYDSPFMTVQESANPVINASNLPGRFVNFYGLSVEDIIKGQGFKFDNVTTEFPDPTSDRIWIRRGRYINIRGGLINAGDITTGSVLRIGDSSLGQPVISCLVDADVYAFAGNGYAIKAEAVTNLNVTKEFWLSDGVKAIKDPAGGRVPAEDRQPTLTRMPGSQAVLRAVNEAAGAGDSPTLQLGDGNGNNLLLGQVGTNTGYSQFLLKPAAAAAATFVGDTNGALWTSGTQLKLGSAGNKVAWALLAPQSGEPYDKSVGSLALADSANWNPLARVGTAPYLVAYDGTAWNAMTTDRVVAIGNSQTEGPTIISAYPSQFPGRPVVNLGISGQTSSQIAARVGAGPSATFTVVGGNLPASGADTAVTLTGGPDLLFASSYREIKGTLNGRHGRLSRTGAGAYTFTPDPAGAATSCPGTYAIVPDFVQRGYIQAIWIGRNDPFTALGIVTLKSNIAAIVARASSGKYIVIGELNAQNEPNGNDYCEAIKTLNSDELALYGFNYTFDPRSVICVDAAGVLRADGTPNPAFMANDVHPNEVGNSLIARGIAQKIAANNW